MAQSVSQPTVGRVPAGAIVERGGPTPSLNSQLRLQLRQADFTEADLAKADLTNAELTDADLTRANLTEANLSRVDLSQRRRQVDTEVPD